MTDADASAGPAAAHRRSSACFFHADPERPVFKGKTLLYVEESMLDLVGRAGALALMLVPDRSRRRRRVDRLRRRCSTASCWRAAPTCAPGPTARSRCGREWEGDEIRDRYEIELIHAFHDAGKPVLGICRGIADPQRGLRRHALPGHRHPGAGLGRPPQLGHLRRQPPRDRPRRGSRLADLYPGPRGSPSTASTTRR